VDGRWVPTVAAPGEEIASTRNDLGGTCAGAIPGTNDLYAFCSGTSMAAPHVSGSIALLTQWWRSLAEGSADPSPALAKALLVNTAVDMPGAATGPIPNIHEGWGRIHLESLFGATVPFAVRDQDHLFGEAGESLVIPMSVWDDSQPLKVTLGWSDAPGAPGANPALVNDLDLIVETDGTSYLGNVFADGWSTSGGTADALNNLENVYVELPGSTATITIQVANLPGDGVPYNGDATDQDFALVCQNCSVNLLFQDGFESADTAAWDETTN
jgi:subtilisin family serine protease